MKKFLAGAIFGWMLSGAQLAYREGVFHRSWDVMKYPFSVEDPDPIDLRATYDYIASGQEGTYKKDPDSTTISEERRRQAE